MFDDAIRKTLDFRMHSGAGKGGLARAHAKGKTWGRPRTSPQIEGKIRELAAAGMGKQKIARTLGICKSVAQRVLAS